MARLRVDMFDCWPGAPSSAVTSPLTKRCEVRSHKRVPTTAHSPPNLLGQGCRIDREANGVVPYAPNAPSAVVDVSTMRKPQLRQGPKQNPVDWSTCVPGLATATV